MTEPQFAIVRIPFQRIELDLTIEVEHPLKIPCEFTQDIQNHEVSTYQNEEDYVESSFMRLVTIANRHAKDPDGFIRKISKSVEIVRDLICGKFWPLSEIGVELNDNQTYRNIEVAPRVGAQTLDSERLSEIIEPVAGYLSKLSDLNRNELSQYTQIVNYQLGDPQYVASQVRLITSTDGRKQWIHSSGSFRALISDFIDTIPGFEPTLPEIREVETEYPYSPEVQALVNLRKLGNRDRIDYAKTICKTLVSQIKQETQPRLQSIQTIVGSSSDMWDAAIQVLKTSDNTAFILSSFTNHYTLEHVSQRLLEATSESNLKQLLISVGEPDRISGQEYMKKTRDYLSKLEDRLSPKLDITSGVSQRPNHVKLVIADSGWILLTTTNLLSSSPDIFVLESGALIQDTNLSNNLIETIESESWLPQSLESPLNHMKQNLSLQRPLIYETSKLEEKLEKTYQGLNSKKPRNRSFALNALENQLQKTSEYPQYQIIVNEAHRNLLVDSANRFNERLVLASDGLRESGLDLAIINSIKRRAKTVHKTSRKKPILQVWWGRHAPESEPASEEDSRGREQAKTRLSLLRESNHYDFYPRKSNEPMETHTKLIMIDDSRLVLTSDNFLAFGDPEFYQGESGELGLLIDHPRIARQHRGQMELWLPEARNNKDLTRWGAALADEIYYITYTNHTSIPLEEAIIGLLLRILDISSIREGWTTQFDSKSQRQIIQEIVDISWNNGGIVGLFHASGSGSGNYRSISVEQTLVSLSGDPIWRDYTKEEEKFSKLIIDRQNQTLKKRIQDVPITPKVFSEALYSEMKNPYEWTVFTGIYDKVSQKNFLFNLKLRNINPTDFLQKCSDYLEIDIRQGHHWFRMRRI